MYHRLIIAALCVALLAPGCGAWRAAYDDTRAGDVSAPADEALRVIAGGYEALASAREAVLLLYLGGVLDKPRAIKARDALVEVGEQLGKADALLVSGLPEQAITVALLAKARAEAIVKEARG